MKEVLRGGALALLVTAVWAAVYGKLQPRGWLSPIGYCWDGLFGMGMVKASADLQSVPLLPKVNRFLGAPFEARWNDFPIEDCLYFFWGLVAKVTGVVVAVNLGFWLCAAGSAVALYAVGRGLRLRWEACFLAGALFGLSPYLFYRGVSHFALTSYWHLPLMVPIWVWVGGKRGLRPSGRRFWLSVGGAALFGVLNAYYLNYFLQLLGLGVLTQGLRRRWRAAFAGAAVGAAALVSFAAMNLDTLAETVARGPNQEAIRRGAADVEVYALKPVQLFVPGPRHRLAAFVEAGERHKRATTAAGEFPGPYLGVVGGAAFVGLMLHLLSSVLRGRVGGWARFGLFGAVLTFGAMVGGGLQIAQLLTGVVLFRSNNRASILLLMLALLFLARVLTVAARRWPQGALAGVVAVLLAVGLFDQTPSPTVDPNVPWCEPEPQRSLMARADQRLVEALERQVPPGTRVFQLPPMVFPEGGWARGVPDYEQFRPYLYSKQLRFSFGNMKGRPEASWQAQTAALPLGQLRDALTAKGFGAIYILRKAYSPAQLNSLLSSLRLSGPGDVLHSEHGDSLVVLLR